MQCGDKGTAHLHTKIPTHQSVDAHMCWMLYNRPQEKRVYSVNGSWREISRVGRFDPTATFVVIHNNHDTIKNSFGRINCMIKWPTYLYGWLYRFYPEGPKHIHADFDPYNCTQDRILRNYLVWKPHCLHDQSPVDFGELQELVDRELRWYKARNEKQPHEVNAQYYVTDCNYLANIFEIDITTVFSLDFLPWFNNFMHTSNVSDRFDLDLVQSRLPDFVAAQENLQWFDSMQAWNNTGLIDSYLTSHSAIEAEFIRHIHHILPQSYHWDWDAWTLQQLSDRYYNER